MQVGQIWRICSCYEFARECKFIRHCINQNTTLNVLLKATIKKFSAKPTNSNSQSAFRFHRGIKSARLKRHRQKRYKQKRDKITIQINPARQHKAMTYDVIT